jgi:hypothetical protein
VPAGFARVPGIDTIGSEPRRFNIYVFPFVFLALLSFDCFSRLQRFPFCPWYKKSPETGLYFL